MSNQNSSLVAVATVQLWPTLVTFNSSLGYEAGVGVPLCVPNGTEITHRGLHTWAHPHFVAIATGKVVPEVAGIPREMVLMLLNSIKISVDPVIGGEPLKNSGHFNHVIKEMKLEIFVSDVEKV